MVMRVERVGGRLVIPVPPEALELSEGATVEVRLIDSETTRPEHRHASVEEGLDAFRRTEHLHKKTYQELAK
jgi:antitoxin component of MazEF toxin-antitoxin module